MASELWANIDRIIEDLPDSADVYALRSHGVSMLAAHHWREIGRPVPSELLADERAAHVRALAAPVMLTRIRESIEGPILVLKGPEVSAYYPDPALRQFNDLDLLVRSEVDTRRALLASGFITLDTHGRLALPGMPLFIELHEDPRWLPGTLPPPAETWFSAAIPSATGVDGVKTLDPTHQTVLLAVHAWAHLPFRQLRDLVDIATMMKHVDPVRVEALADGWGVGPVWRLTAAAVATVLLGQPNCLPRYARPWVQHLVETRDRTNLEVHGARLFGSVVAPSLTTLLHQVIAVGRYYVSPNEERSMAPLAYAKKIAFLTRHAGERHFDTHRTLQG